MNNGGLEAFAGNVPPLPAKASSPATGDIIFHYSSGFLGTNFVTIYLILV
jgi:hypothetical protein